MTTIPVHCPNCGTTLDVGIVVATVTLSQEYAPVDNTINVTLKARSVAHSCPDPTKDGNEKCRAARGDGLLCVRDKGHNGKHGYGGIFWADEGGHLWRAET